MNILQNTGSKSVVFIRLKNDLLAIQSTNNQTLSFRSTFTDVLLPLQG